MAKAVRPEFEYHYIHKTLDRTERRRVIRQGYHDFQFFGWQKDPPYGISDPKRWLWQNGAEEAEKIRHTGKGDIEDTPGWL